MLAVVGLLTSIVLVDRIIRQDVAEPRCRRSDGFAGCADSSSFG